MKLQKMDIENQTNTEEEDSKDSSKSTPILEGEEFIHQTKNSSTVEYNIETKKQKQSIINKYKSMSTSDTIAAWQLVANVIGGVIGIGLFAFTILTFMEAIKTNAISEKNYKLAKESYETGSKENNERFELQSKQAQGQINALNEAVENLKKEFEFENTPFISVRPEGPISVVTNNVTVFKAVILNHGKYPTKIIKSNMAVVVTEETEKAIKSFKKKEFEIVDLNLLVSKEYPGLLGFDSKLPIDPNEINNVISNQLMIFWMGEIEYEHPTSKTTRKYSFIIRYRFSNSFNTASFEYLKNENEDIPPLIKK
jgi:hypothetical protein